MYGENLVGVYGSGVSHNIPINGDLDMEWFGITGSGAPTTTSTVPGPTSTTPAPSPTGCTSPRWAQCGGIGFTGCTTCESPYTCNRINDYYSQCL